MVGNTAHRAHGTPYLELSDAVVKEDEEVSEDVLRRKRKRKRRKRRMLIDMEIELQSDLLKLGMNDVTLGIRLADYTKQVRI